MVFSFKKKLILNFQWEEKKAVPKTETGWLVEDTKAFDWKILKELGKMTP